MSRSTPAVPRREFGDADRQGCAGRGGLSGGGQPGRQPNLRHALWLRRDARDLGRERLSCSACSTSRRRWRGCRRGSALSPPTPPRRSPGAALVENLRQDELAASVRNVGYPVVGPGEGAEPGSGATRPDAGPIGGATTQDIMDTAIVLQVRDGLALVRAELVAIARALAGQADRHRRTVMAGRTHLQHALPTTFGLKCAVWLMPLIDHVQRLDQLRPRVERVEFGGAAGTLASLGDQGLAVMEGLAAELGLAAPPAPWHVARDGLAETVVCAGSRLRQPGENGDRRDPAGTNRNRRGIGALYRRPWLQLDHAAEAQPDRVGIRARGPARCAGAGAADAGCDGRRPRARHRPLAGGAIGAAAGVRADGRRAAACAHDRRGAWWSTPAACAATSTRRTAASWPRR